jgi:DNA-binding HxlR family transcriptional regulator
MQKTSKEVYKWIQKEESRKQILTMIGVPLTAKQISKKTGIPAEICSYIVGNFVNRGILICLNPEAQNSRVFGLSEFGIQCQQHCIPDGPEYRSIDIDWSIYGWICYNHRSTVLRMLTDPMQPSEIRRKIKKKLPQAKISANNTRDVIRLFLEKGIVQKVSVRKKAHPQYELTEFGTKLQSLLIKAESRLSS